MQKEKRFSYHSLDAPRPPSSKSDVKSCLNVLGFWTSIQQKWYERRNTRDTEEKASEKPELSESIVVRNLRLTNEGPWFLPRNLCKMILYSSWLSTFTERTSVCLIKPLGPYYGDKELRGRLKEVTFEEKEKKQNFNSTKTL